LPASTPDPRRFQYTNNSFPVRTAAEAKDQQVTQKITIAHTISQTAGISTQSEYSVGLNLETGANILDLVKATLKDENTWTWTDTVASSTSNGSTESATIVVGGPAFGYQGTTDNIDVYYDTIYKTFLFWPVSSSSASLSGTIMARSGQPAKRQEVIVYANGVRHRTFTIRGGQYHVFGRVVRSDPNSGGWLHERHLTARHAKSRCRHASLKCFPGAVQCLWKLTWDVSYPKPMNRTAGSGSRSTSGSGPIAKYSQQRER